MHFGNVEGEFSEVHSKTKTVQSTVMHFFHSWHQTVLLKREHLTDDKKLLVNTLKDP